jgi:hypothetical protein
MKDKTKAYRITAMAGYFVAGQRVPLRGNTETGQPEPVVGSILHLTDEQARYELLAGSIEAADDTVATDEPQPTNRRKAS